jgi:hypothetical protein
VPEVLTKFGQTGAKVALLTVSSSRAAGGAKSANDHAFHHGDLVQKSAAIEPLSVANKKLYCARHGCEFVLGKDQAGVSDKSRSSRWNKIAWLKHLLKQGKYEYVIWMDLDTLFMTDKDMMQYVNPNVDIHFTADLHNQGIIFALNLQ